MFAVGGRILLYMAMAALIRPGLPAAYLKCPIFDFTELIPQKFFFVTPMASKAFFNAFILNNVSHTCSRTMGFYIFNGIRRIAHHLQSASLKRVPVPLHWEPQYIAFPSLPWPKPDISAYILSLSLRGVFQPL